MVLVLDLVLDLPIITAMAVITPINLALLPLVCKGGWVLGG